VVDISRPSVTLKNFMFPHSLTYLIYVILTVTLTTFLISFDSLLMSVFQGLRESSAIVWHISVWSNIFTTYFWGEKFISVFHSDVYFAWFVTSRFTVVICGLIPECWRYPCCFCWLLLRPVGTTQTKPRGAAQRSRNHRLCPARVICLTPCDA